MLLMIEKPRPTAAERAWAILSRAARAALSTADAVVLWPFHVFESRRILETLGALSDHDLRDIGLTRQDLRDALALPSGRDPGHLLAARRGDRRGRW